MRKPYEHTLTPADRIVFQKWLVGTSAFWGVVTLLVIGVAIANHDRTATALDETTSVARSGTQDSPSCRGRSKQDTRLVGRGHETAADDVFPGCI
jgi:hypothetical protein